MNVGQPLGKVARVRGVPQARHLAERAVAPYLRADLHQLAADHGATEARVGELERIVFELAAALELAQRTIHDLVAHQPTILNAISSANGTARLLTRDATELRGRIDQVELTTEERLDATHQALEESDRQLRSEMRPHIDTVAYLLKRVETVRAEMLHELRYGREPRSAAVEPRVINPTAMERQPRRLNLGAGHVTLESHVNVDIRELPGIDVVAAIDELPFEQSSVDEIVSSHTLEHFPEQQLRRQLLPYWFGLLKPGGTFRAIVPDLGAMTAALNAGELGFDTFRNVVYGGQEYEGDFHFNGFTTVSLAQLLESAGFERTEVVAAGRVNGDCLEMEITATKPVG